MANDEWGDYLGSYYTNLVTAGIYGTVKAFNDGQYATGVVSGASSASAIAQLALGVHRTYNASVVSGDWRQYTTSYTYDTGRVEEPLFDPIDAAVGAAFGAAVGPGGAIVGGLVAGVARGVLRRAGTNLLTSVARTSAERLSAEAAKRGLTLGTHAMGRLVGRESHVSLAAVARAIAKGRKFYDPKNDSVVSVLEGGFASGKSLLVAQDPVTGAVRTVISGRKLTSSRFQPLE
jgi:hypothetical protein